MASGLTLQRRLPFLGEFPAEAQEAARKAAAMRDAAAAERVAGRDRMLAGASQVARRAVAEVLGPETSTALRALMRAESLTWRDLMQPPGGLTRDYAAANAARRKQANKLLKKLGADIGKLRKIGLAFQAAVEAAPVTAGRVAPGFHLASNLETWLDLSPLHVKALPWGVLDLEPDPSDPHRWQVFRSPFFGFDFGFLPVRSNNFTVDREHILSPPAGLVGLVTTMDNPDADDFDYASVDAHSQIAFAFTPPATGLVEVLIDAQSTIGTHHIRTEDEWGWSNSTTHQTNHLMMDVLHPNVPEPSFAQMSTVTLRTDDDETLHRENLTRGQHYFARLFAAGPVPAGQSVVITAGTRSFDLSGTNDVSIRSRAHFEWFISSVEVRIAP